MPIHATCPNCERAYNDLPDSVSGKKIKCKCGVSFTVQKNLRASTDSEEDDGFGLMPEVVISDHEGDLNEVASSDFRGILLAQIFLLVIGFLLLAVAAIQAISFFTTLNSKSALYDPPSIWVIISAIYLSVLGITSLLVACFLKLGLAIHLNLRKIANRS